MGTTSTLSTNAADPQQALIEQFVQERTYLKNVTPKTVQWYRHSFQAFDGAITDRSSILSRITMLRDRGVSAISGNTYLRAVNAYFRWCHSEGHVPELIRVPKLKEPEQIPATLTPEQVQRVIRFNHAVEISAGFMPSRAFCWTRECVSMKRCRSDANTWIWITSCFGFTARAGRIE